MKDLLSALPKSAEFLAFWNVYPRKKGKLAAERAYTTARRIATHEQIMSGLMLYPFRADPSKQPHPATWLHAGNWIIEADTPPPTIIVAPLPGRRSSVDTFLEDMGLGDD